ncbi:hypothetical protein STANM309S_03504 [Streptomyces tanashiensis]
MRPSSGRSVPCRPLRPAGSSLPPTNRSAVAWLPPAELWPPVQHIRREHDRQIGRWPPHVNVLFGFVPEAEFDRALPLVAAALAETPPFTARLAGVHWFGHREDATVWLDPAAAGHEPWARLRESLELRFPLCGSQLSTASPRTSPSAVPPTRTSSPARWRPSSAP